MPYTVWGAFDQFRKDIVDLRKEDTDRARSSRDYLFGQLKRLHIQDNECPNITDYLSYGSFARRTKVRPLDDIDILALLQGGGLTSEKSSEKLYSYRLKINNHSAALARFDDGRGYVNSTKVLNQIKRSLSRVQNYRKADIKRNQQAVVLDLSSYDWVFDIVPAVGISSIGNTTNDHYLIPDGNGDWMKTDPRRDTRYVTRVSGQHNGKLIPTMRLLKYWNWRNHKPRLPSYYFEILSLKTCDFSPTISGFQTSVRYFFRHCPYYLDVTCPDPKELGANLDSNVDSDTKRRVKDAMKSAESAAFEAISHEDNGNYRSAIDSWKKVFGPSFPNYGE